MRSISPTRINVGRGLLQRLVQAKAPAVQDGDHLYLIKLSAKPLDPGTVAECILKIGMFPIRYGDIKAIAESSKQGIFRMAADTVPFEVLPVDVQIAEDESEASLFPVGQPEFKQPIQFLLLLQTIRKAGITHGILHDQVDLVASYPEKLTQEGIKIAQQIEPVPGKDALLEYHFSPDTSYVPLRLEDGSVDFHHVDVVKCVTKGQKLVTKHPATEGSSGYTITGHAISPPLGADVPLPKGKCTETSGDETELLASQTGHAFIQDGKVHVEEVLIVQKNVDYSTGDVNFSGEVIIRGDVLSDFKVLSKENIHINQQVERAEVRTESGSIFVNRGIHGGERAVLHAAVDIRAGFAEQANLTAGKSVIIKDSLIQCNVNAGESVEVLGGKGVVVGGTIHAGHRLSCKILGADQGGQTYVEVGTLLDEKKTKKLEKVRERQQPILEEIEKVKKAAEMMKEVGVETSAAEALLKKHVEAWQEVEHEAMEIYNLQSEDGIVVQKGLLPGVTISMAGRKLTIAKQYGPCAIRLVGEKIEILPLSDKDKSATSQPEEKGESEG
jgi:uncharacterized protein (DUF342 family)